MASGGTSGDGVIRLWCTEGAREERGGEGGGVMGRDESALGEGREGG